MTTIRLAILGSSPCGSCVAACCKQNGHAYAVLLQGEQERRRFAPWAKDIVFTARGNSAVDGKQLRVSERVIMYKGGRCPFLGDGNKCDIYEDRPMSCRQFECIDGYHSGGADMTGHSIFLQRNDVVLQLLRSL